MSGPVGKAGFASFKSSRLISARANSASSSNCAPAPAGRCAIRARDVAIEAMSLEHKRIARRNQNALLAPRKAEHHGIVQSR